MGAPTPTVTWIDFVSATEGWGLAGNALLRTRDAGMTWQAVPTPVPIGSACFVDSQHGWIANAATAPTGLWTTANGGQRWSEVDLPAAAHADGLTRGGWPQRLGCAAPNTLWDVVALGGDPGGEAYVLARSGDGGLHWTAIVGNQQPLPLRQGPDHVAGALAVASSSMAYLLGWCGACGGTGTTEVGGTTDSGATWTNTQVLDHAVTDSALSFPTTTSGWLVARWLAGPRSAHSAVLRTTDSGRTWTQCLPGPSK